MNSLKNINALGLGAVVALASFAAFSAADASETMKPLQGLSFHAGSEHAVGYFLTDNGDCRLVLTRADDDNFAPTRFEAVIKSGHSTRYELAQGKSYEFGCQAAGQLVSIDALETTAGN